MLGDVIAYSGIVTKIRGMRAKMLTLDDYRKISQCRNVVEILGFLKESTSYSSLIDRVDPSMYSRSAMESLLMESVYEDYIKLYRFANSKQKQYLRYFIRKYEVELIKYCIGIVFNHYPRPFDIEFKKDFFRRYSTIDIEKLVDSESIAALVENLRGSEYYPIMRIINANDTSTIFDYELALDLYYFRFMWSLRKKLTDKKEIETITREIGSNIDLLNLSWIYRAKKYYNLIETEIYSLLIPIHYKIRDDEMRKMVESPTAEDYLKVAAQSYYGRKFEMDDEKNTIERIERVYLDSIYKKAFVNNPYSMASIQGYLYFKEREIQKIIVAIECIRYGYDEVRTFEYVTNAESEVDL